MVSLQTSRNESPTDLLSSTAADVVGGSSVHINIRRVNTIHTGRTKKCVAQRVIIGSSRPARRIFRGMAESGGGILQERSTSLLPTS